MLYRTYDARRMMIAPVYATAALQSGVLRGLARNCVRPARSFAPGARSRRPPQCSGSRTSGPSSASSRSNVDGETIAVEEEVVRSTPFGSLVRFAKPAAPDQPRILVVPGLAGHFATLVRPTVRRLLSDHDVFVADWHNARDMPVSAGRFGLDEYVDHLIEFMDAIGPGGHLMAVCQPCPAVLTAAAMMAEDNHPAEPASLILMAGPVDARRNPGPVNRFACKQSVGKLERRVISTVPWPHRGAGRKVYPGFLQVAGFMGMNPGRHVSAIGRARAGPRLRQRRRREATQAFYKEYFAVLDVTAEFYLETARAVFIDHDLPRGRTKWQGRRVDPSAIRTSLLTIEAENDEICPPGQTQAAHDLCTGIPAERKRHHLQPGAGHYGVFSGTRFDREIYPEIKSFVAMNELRPAAA